MKPLEKILKNYFGGNIEATKDWLNTSNLGFKGEAPADILNNSLGGYNLLLEYAIKNMNGKQFKSGGSNNDKEC